MIVNLMPLEEETNEKVLELAVPYDKQSFAAYGSVYPLVTSKPFQFIISRESGNKLSIRVTGSVETVIPCDRCLTPVSTVIRIDFLRTVHIKDEDVADWDDERSFISGYSLDTDILLESEIMIEWPVKTLCRSDCTGIAYLKDDSQGNLPDESEGNIDSRMAAIRDIFNACKEV